MLDVFLKIGYKFKAVSKCFPLTAGFKIKSKVPDFEPVEAKRRSRSSGTQILDKRGRFEIGSLDIL